MTAPMDVFARRALGWIPTILTLQDRNPMSPTYGSFDRNFWQYRIIDFPSGMAQEFVWPLALALTVERPDNPFHGQDAIREWIAAGIRYAARSSHADGSCDDYFPYERATGAAAFSLLASLDAYHLAGLEDGEMMAFFERRARWLAHHQESGQLSNHEALVVSCLVRLGELEGSDRWRGDAERRLDRLLSWQSGEGWFSEYGGCDTGYLTLTISLLAWLDGKIGGDLREPLTRAIRFVSEFVHPDGSFGGEYTSRNTYNFFPHGFELAGRFLPEALAVNDRIAAGLEAGLGADYADDHIIGHHAWNYLLAWRDRVEARPAVAPRAEGRQVFPEAGLVIDRRQGQELYLATNKGGVFKLFRDGKLAATDTQVTVAAEGRVAVAHLADDYAVEMDADGIAVSGDMGWAKQTGMTTVRLVILRAVMLTGGRFFPNLIRRLLQKMLISGKKAAPFAFRRRLAWSDGAWTVRDEVSAGDWSKVTGAGIGGHQTSIYVVMSRTFQMGQLLPWRDLGPDLAARSGEAPLVVERKL